MVEVIKIKKGVDEFIKQIQDKYKAVLDRIPDELIDDTISVIKGKKRTNAETDKVLEIMEKFKKDIKRIMIINGETLTHITSVAPENMRNGRIEKSINRENNYRTEVGDWVFAGSYIDGTDPYIARNSEDGMIILNHDTYIYGGDNIDVKTDIDGKKHAILRKPNYVYRLNPERFTPVVTLLRNNKGRPFFHFSREWVSDKDVCLDMPNQVLGIEEVIDVTELLEHCQIFSDIHKSNLARKLRSVEKEDRLSFMRKLVNSGELRYLNYETGINQKYEIKEISEGPEFE